MWWRWGAGLCLHDYASLSGTGQVARKRFSSLAERNAGVSRGSGQANGALIGDRVPTHSDRSTDMHLLWPTSVSKERCAAPANGGGGVRRRGSRKIEGRRQKVRSFGSGSPVIARAEVGHPSGRHS